MLMILLTYFLIVHLFSVPIKAQETTLFKEIGEELDYTCFTPLTEKKNILLCARDTCLFSIENKRHRRELKQTLIIAGRRKEQILVSVAIDVPLILRIMASKGSVCILSFSENGEQYTIAGDEFNANGQTLKIIIS